MESTYRRAGSADMSRIAELRWASIVGEKKAEPELDFGEFLQQFGAWALRRSDTHLPLSQVQMGRSSRLPGLLCRIECRALGRCSGQARISKACSCSRSCEDAESAVACSTTF